LSIIGCGCGQIAPIQRVGETFTDIGNNPHVRDIVKDLNDSEFVQELCKFMNISLGEFALMDHDDLYKKYTNMTM
jgi:hypothetical protein